MKSSMVEEEEEYAGSQAHCVGAHPFYHPLSRQGLLDPVKLAYHPHSRKAGNQHLKQLGQYYSSHGHRRLAVKQNSLF